jgi:hypothetical protein
MPEPMIPEPTIPILFVDMTVMLLAGNRLPPSTG